jgi:hypothetical protein
MTARKCSHCLRTTCPPLVLVMISHRRFYPSHGPLPKFLKIDEWFLPHGADLLECWPNSNTTALHCMANKAALIGWDQPMDRICSQSLIAILSRRLTDSCNCSCSINGCTTLLLFWKAAFRCRTGYIGSVSELLDTGVGAEIKPAKLPYMHRWGLEREVRRVEKAVTSPVHHWIVIQFIRFRVFSLLGILHTCCHLAFVPKESGFDKRPCPRYSPNELEGIQIEDESLRGLLEVNVEILQAAYSKHKGGLQGFIDELLLPRMSYVLTEEICHAVS